MKAILLQAFALSALRRARVGAGPRRRRVPGQHLHDRYAVAIPRSAMRARRRLRGRLAELRPGRRRHRGLRPAVRRTRASAGRRVPGQHLHDRRPVRARRRHRTPGETSWSSGSSSATATGVRRPGPALRRTGSADGDEFRVNTFTTASQCEAARRRGRPTVAGFVVLGRARTSTAAASASAARRFDASGAPVGGDFVVNTAHDRRPVSKATVAVLRRTAASCRVGRPRRAARRVWERHLRPAVRRRRGPLGGDSRSTLHDGRPAALRRSAYPREGGSWWRGRASSATETGKRDGPPLRRLREPGRRRFRGQHDDGRRPARGRGRDRPRRPGQLRRHLEAPRFRDIPARSSASASTLPAGRRGVEFRVNDVHDRASSERPAVASDDVGNFVVDVGRTTPDRPAAPASSASASAACVPAALAVDTDGQPRARARRDGGRAPVLAQRRTAPRRPSAAR